MKRVILLTGCINPNGMPFTKLTDANERQKQYINAIQFYIENTDCEIVFCENSNTDITPFFKDVQNRLEVLTFPGNQDKQRGKGYGETEIIEYALLHSSYIQGACIIIKITGRLIINNICPIIKSLKYKYDFVTCLFHSNLTFADSRIICGTTAFYKEFLNNKEYLNDSEGIFFEHVLASTVRDSSICFIPFSEKPMIIGSSGTTGELYHDVTTNKKEAIKYRYYSWIQLKKIYLHSPHRHHSLLKKICIQLKILKYQVLSKIM